MTSRFISDVLSRLIFFYFFFSWNQGKYVLLIYYLYHIKIRLRNSQWRNVVRSLTGLILLLLLLGEDDGRSITLPRLRVSTLSSGTSANRASTLNPATKRSPKNPFSRRSADRMSWSGSRAHSLQVLRPFPIHTQQYHRLHYTSSNRTAIMQRA